MITKTEKFLNRLDALEAAEKSPNLDEMQGPFILNNRTLVYFPKRMSDDKVKSRIKMHLKNLESVGSGEFMDEMKIIRNTKTPRIDEN